MHHSQLFALRLWTEPGDPDAHALRFKVEHVLSGRARYARTWDEVEAFVMQIFQEAEKGDKQWQSTDSLPC